MATKTTDEMANYVLEHMGIKAVGVPASAADHQAAVESVESVVSGLSRDGLSTFAASSIPDWACGAVRALVAYDLRSAFGVSGERLMDIVRSEPLAKQEIASRTSAKHNAKITTGFCEF